MRYMGWGTGANKILGLSLLFFVGLGASAGEGTTTASNGNSSPASLVNYATIPRSGVLHGYLKAADSDNRADELLFSLDPNNPNFAGPVATAKGGHVWLTDTTTGAFVYKPNPSNHNGGDSFEYRVDDPASFALSTQAIGTIRRIMPLGDSITQGTLSGQRALSARVSYRRKLQNDLTARGFDADFVGSMRNGRAASPPISDPDNEGWPGFTAADIANGQSVFPGVFGALNLNPADVVLLHIGTNNINFDSNSTTVIDILKILNEIDRWEKSPQGNPITVFVAQIVDRSNSECPTLDGCTNAKVVDLNRRIAVIVAKRKQAGDRVVLVNEYDALNYPEDMGVQNGQLVHPNAIGYEKMAAPWLRAILSSGVLR